MWYGGLGNFFPKKALPLVAEQILHEYMKSMGRKRRLKQLSTDH